MMENCTKKWTKWMAAGLLLFTVIACNRPLKPEINGSDHQPILDGWTYEEAGEYWLTDALDLERGGVAQEGASWMTAEQLANLEDENIQVHLPLAPEGSNPQPLDGATYSEAEEGGFVTFHLMDDSVLEADSLLNGALKELELTAKDMMTIGRADVNLREVAYAYLDTTLTCYVQQRGRGIYTLYYIADLHTYTYPYGRIQSLAAVMAVHPGADSITICRGNILGPNYIREK